MTKSNFTPTQIQRIIEFAQAELRRRFDSTSSNLLAIDTIEEARLLGFEQLGEEMIRDLSTSQDDMSEAFIRKVIATHEEKNDRQYEPDNTPPSYDYNNHNDWES